VGLYDYRARWYEPTLGRFVQPDTIVPEPGKPQALNRYAYVYNNPLRFSDPSGYFSEEEIQQYLRSSYKDNWYSYWLAWRSDQLFWEMLLMADYGDVLYAPTTQSLGPGLFKRGEGTFAFVGEHELWEYQGYGPYRLLGRSGEEKLPLATELGLHPSDFLSSSPVEQVWEQPLCRYTGEGPQFSGYYRRVSYRYANTKPNSWAGDDVPWVFGTLAPWAVRSILKRVGVSVTCPYCALVLSVSSGLTVLNNFLTFKYEIQVEMIDKRTFLMPANVYMAPPPDESSDLWK